MERSIHTIGKWRPKPGREAEFVSTWEALSDAFNRLPNPPASPGTLVRSQDEPDLYYCFGTWRSIADVEALKESPDAQLGLYALRQLCMEFSREAFAVLSVHDESSGHRQETDTGFHPERRNGHRDGRREIGWLESSIAGRG